MKIPPGFVWFEQQIAEAKFCGLLREGFADAVTECCRRIDGKPDAVCKDRAKIRAVLVGDFFVKRYNLPGWWNQLRRPWRGGRPERVLLVTETLLAHELMAVPVVAALSEKSASGIRDYLITEIFPAGMCEADKVLPLPGSDDGGWQQLLTGILPVVAQWHNAGVEHGDLNLRNICVTADFSQVCPIDLDGGIIALDVVAVIDVETGGAVQNPLGDISGHSSGSQAQNHNEAQDDSDNLLHCDFLQNI